MVFYDSNSEGEDDPMVSGPVNHLKAKVDIAASHSGARGVLNAFLDSGCTHCLIGQATVWKLELHVRELKKP